MLKRILIISLFAFLNFNLFGQISNFAEKPEHLILLVVDDIAPETWERHELPNLEKMISEGELVEKLYVP